MKSYLNASINNRTSLPMLKFYSTKSFKPKQKISNIPFSILSNDVFIESRIDRLSVTLFKFELTFKFVLFKSNKLKKAALNKINAIKNKIKLMLSTNSDLNIDFLSLKSVFFIFSFLKIFQMK